MKVFQREPVAPALVGDYEYIALVMTPNQIALREWSGDAVTDLASEAVDSVRGVWYDVTVAWDGAELTVSRGPSGGALTELFTAETTLENDSTDIGFGVGEKAEYRFDEVRLSSPSLSPLEPSKLTEYVYDALGRRVAMTDYVGASAYTTRYLYAGNRIIEELDGDNNLQASYVYGPYVDEVLQMKRDTNGDHTLDATYYYLHDDMYNVLALTDADGELVERYEYGDYGAPTVYNGFLIGSSSYVGNPFLFNGREYDTETRLYFYRTRYMDPIQGRFISRDTIGLWGDANSMGNPYSYVGNNPWSRLDPFGEYGANPLHSAALDYQMKYGYPEAPAAAKRLLVTTGIAAINIGAWFGGPVLGLSVNGITAVGSAGYSAHSRNEQYKAYTGESPTLGQLTTAVAADMTLVSAGYTVVAGEDAFIGVPVSKEDRAEIAAHVAIGLAGGYAGRQVALAPRSSGATQTAGRSASVSPESVAPRVFNNLFPEDVTGAARFVSPAETSRSGFSRNLDFVVLEDGSLRMIHKTNDTGHVDAALGKPVLAAGQVEFRNGKVKLIDNSSGHYLPTGEFAQQAALKAFQDAGIEPGPYIEKVFDPASRKWVSKE